MATLKRLLIHIVHERELEKSRNDLARIVGNNRNREQIQLLATIDGCKGKKLWGSVYPVFVCRTNLSGITHVSL